MDKQYYAFISYSRKDLQIARTIQQKLEKYPYPADKVAEEFRPHDSKYIRRVFLDVTDLSARERVFTDELKKEIRKHKVFNSDMLEEFVGFGFCSSRD